MTKQTNGVSQKFVNSFFDRGDGVVEFPNGLVITDDSVMWSGTKYDIDSLNIDEYPGQLTLDHFDSIGGDYLIGKVEGVHKQGNKVVVDRIRYAVNASENAKRAYELLKGGFSNAFSIETIGPWADEETNTMYNHKLVGLSQVVMGNNKHAVANSIKPITHQVGEFETEDKENCSAVHEVRVKNDVEAQVEEGVEVTKSEEVKAETEVAADEALEVLENDLAAETCNDAEAPAEEAEVKEEVKAEEVEPSTDDDEEVVEKSEEEAEVENSAEEPAEAETEEVAEEEAEKAEDEAEEAETETEEEAEEAETEVENSVEESEEAVADDTDEAAEEEPAADEAEAEEVEAEVEEEAQEETNINNKVEETEMTKEEISKLINEAIKNFAEAQVAPAAEEPAVEEAEAKEDNSYSLEKHANLIMRALKTKSALDYEALARVNNANLEALKAAGKVSNSMTIEDWGNFVLPPEMYDRLIGKRTDYSAIIEATDWRETDRLEFAWLTRNGDIEMTNTAMCEARPATNPDRSNLKPITTYGAVRHIEQMEHLGAVTPVCSAATKYLAVDLIADAIAGYRNNYDKKKAELVIAKLQEAVNISDNKVAFDNEATYDNKLKTFIDTLAKLSDATSTGTFVFTEKTLLKIMEYVTPRESALGDRAFDAGKDGIKRVFGTPYIVVPNSLMPSLEDDAANNPVISYIPVDAASTAPQNIEITSTVFYGDLSLFTGYTSGGLQFDMTEYAAYEDANGVVRSAYQRDEIVLRGYFYRGGAYRYPQAMAAITNEAISE